MKHLKIARWLFAPVLLFTAVFSGFSDTWYVSPSGLDGPGTNWISAFHQIQSAVDMAVSGDTVLVGDGFYNAGGAEIHSMSNRVVVAKSIIVKSLNGPQQALIVGSGPMGPSAVRCIYISDGATVLGFTFTNGYSRASGDVLYECSGGGAWLDGGTISNCIFMGNSALYGGGINCNSSGIIQDCTLSQNTASYDGGGIYVDHDGTLIDCMLRGNVSGVDGGGVYTDYGGTLINCVLSENSASNYGGGAYCNHGGIFNSCSLSSNSAAYGGGVNCNDGGAFNDCMVSGNTANFDGGGLYIDYNGTFTDCILSGNTAVTNGGGVFFDYGGVLNNCTLIENVADNYGGGGFCNRAGTLNSCILNGNEALYGAGMNCYNGGVLNNCILQDNPASFDGGAVYVDFDGVLNNCTLTGNLAAFDGGGVYCDFGGTLNNCIAWGNTPSNWFVNVGGWTNCCSRPSVGVNCITNNPQFLAGDDFRLQPGSPCIDTGITIPHLTIDQEGIPRPLDGDADGFAAPDIGAYEFVSSVADTDGDSFSDFQEYIAVTDSTDADDWFRVTAISNDTFFLNLQSRGNTHCCAAPT
jgi:predicted outer membrane repeat protein